MMTPGELAGRLERANLPELQAIALEAAAARLAGAVRNVLSVPAAGEAATPGEAPLLQSGALRDSVSHAVEGRTAVVGSTDPVAAYQEQGTPRLQPRPFLAPTAAAIGEDLAREIGIAVAEGLR